jgi:molybdopterin/thiamine biosynthesis adenylyltransferase
MAMSSDEDRFARNIALFGKKGQTRLREASVAIVGSGGLGSFAIAELALLGVGAIYPIDDEELSNSNRNRYVGAWHDDPVPGSAKTRLAERHVRSIDPRIRVVPIQQSLFSEEAFAAVREADYVFGCLDDDGPRLVLNELCAAYAKPLFDLASDVPEAGVYGGRICVAWDGTACPYCLGEIDTKAAQRYLASDAERENEDAIYGIKRSALGETGPSVVSINGVVASLAVTEFMAAVTGMRKPALLMTYRGHDSIVTKRRDPPASDCYYCKGLRGQGTVADVERYLRMPHLRRKRSS